MAEGDPTNLRSFVWDDNYDNYVRRFEDFVNVDRLMTLDDLYMTLDEWLPEHQPTQTQMDFFSEYFQFPYYEVPEEKWRYYFELRRGAYNRDNREFGRYEDGKTYIVEEKVYHMWYGDRVVLRDAQTKKILSFLKDPLTGHYYDTRYERG